jgi:hypothetical protein
MVKLIPGTSIGFGNLAVFFQENIVALGTSKRLQISDDVIYLDKNNSKGVILFPCLN